MMSKWAGCRCALVSVIVFNAVVLAIPQESSGSALPLAVAPVQSDSSGPSTDPKCVFLRQELTRVETGDVAVPANIPGNVRDAYASTVQEVRANIARENIASCDRNERLIASPRLTTLEARRFDHVRQVRDAFDGNGADVLVDAVNGLYEAEAQSFYNMESAAFAIRDLDVIKDFPTFLDLLIESELPEELKASFQQNIRFIRYEEAGRLQNSLLGIDLDSGTTSAFLLRAELADRASEEAQRVRIADETQTAALEAQEKSVVLQARITLSISFLVIVGLVGFMLIRREVLTMDNFINVGVVCSLICVVWILVTLGAWEWLQGYIGVAF